MDQRGVDSCSSGTSEPGHRGSYASDDAVTDGIIKEGKPGQDKILKDKPNGSISLRAQAAME